MTNPINSNINNLGNVNNNATENVKGKTQTNDSDVTTTGQQADDGKKTLSSDHVSLTPSVQKMQEIEKSLADLPEVDETRVAKFKQLIENNEYSVNADKVADKLMQMEKLIK